MVVVVVAVALWSGLASGLTSSELSQEPRSILGIAGGSVCTSFELESSCRCRHPSCFAPGKGSSVIGFGSNN